VEEVKQIILRDVVLETPEIETGGLISLWIHDTENKDVNGYYGEFADFLKAAFIAKFTTDPFKYIRTIIEKLVKISKLN
jgi:hypothetical protein